MLAVKSLLKVSGGLMILAVIVPIMLVILIPLLPWRWTRVRICNRFGTVMGASLLWISGCKLSISGREQAISVGPAIYISNHTSIHDAFLAIWLSPLGTVGVAKKQIVYYPLFGLAWLLSGNLSIDRSNPKRAIASLNRLADTLRKNRLSVFLWPEGRRSRDGRIGPFKKGAAHIAIRTGLPIVPVVIEGAHRAWEKNTLVLRGVPIKVTFLPPIDTTGWVESRIDEHIAELRAIFVASLPPDQRPLEFDGLVAA